MVANTVVHLQSKWLGNINEKWDVASLVWWFDYGMKMEVCLVHFSGKV